MRFREPERDLCIHRLKHWLAEGQNQTSAAVKRSRLKERRFHSFAQFLPELLLHFPLGTESMCASNSFLCWVAGRCNSAQQSVFRKLQTDWAPQAPQGHYEATRANFQLNCESRNAAQKREERRRGASETQRNRPNQTRANSNETRANPNETRTKPSETRTNPSDTRARSPAKPERNPAKPVSLRKGASETERN